MFCLDAMTHRYVTREQLNPVIHLDVSRKVFKCQHILNRYYMYTLCCTGLSLIHEMTSRKGRNNVVRLDAQAADGTMLFDTFNAFTIDAAPGYTIHIGARNSSLNLREHVFHQH